MSSVGDVYKAIDNIAPFSSAMPWDNSGLLIGNMESNISGCIVTLDITKEAVEAALQTNAKLIVAHHPVIFSPLKSVLFDSLASKLIENQISVISAHTNLDLSSCGTNKALADCLKLQNQRNFINDDDIGICGDLVETMTPEEFSAYIKSSISSQKVEFTDCGKAINTVAVVSGAGGDYLYDAALSADALLTGEMKYHDMLDSYKTGISVFAAGHYDTECVVIKPLCDILKKAIADVEFVPFFKTKIYTI